MIENDRRVMVVTSSAGARRALCELLAAHGYEPVTAADLALALRRILEEESAARGRGEPVE